MELKYLSYAGVILCLLINALGLFWFCVIVISLIGFLLGCVFAARKSRTTTISSIFIACVSLSHRILSIVYLHHGNVDEFLQKTTQDNPLDDIKPLGLHLGKMSFCFLLTFSSFSNFRSDISPQYVCSFACMDFF